MALLCFGARQAPKVGGVAMRRRWLLLGLGTVALVGLASAILFQSWVASRLVTREKYNQLTFGMTETQVEGVLGFTGTQDARVHVMPFTGSIHHTDPPKLRWQYWDDGKLRISVGFDEHLRLRGKSWRQTDPSKTSSWLISGESVIFNDQGIPIWGFHYYLEPEETSWLQDCRDKLRRLLPW
jgi:hypothetical protein